MVITYTDEKKFTKEQTQRLFLSVGWVSGQYPERLHKALMGVIHRIQRMGWRTSGGSGASA